MALERLKEVMAIIRKTDLKLEPDTLDRLKSPYLQLTYMILEAIIELANPITWFLTLKLFLDKFIWS